MMESAKKQIAKLLIIIGSGVLCAFALALFMLYQYGPTGKYLSQNVIMAPETLSALNFQEQSPSTGKLVRYVFEEIEFTYYDKKKNQIIKVWPNLRQYKKFYDMLTRQSSIKDDLESIKALFYKQIPGKLWIRVKTEMTQKSDIVLQEIQFAEDNLHYRVFLRQPGHHPDAWVYFEHSNIYEFAIKLLTDA